MWFSTVDTTPGKIQSQIRTKLALDQLIQAFKVAEKKLFFIALIF